MGKNSATLYKTAFATLLNCAFFGFSSKSAKPMQILVKKIYPPTFILVSKPVEVSVLRM